eukprot:GHRR01002763.1.p1 GENE.GHRR01002763.1~~GHRR01002763.1.p1  ORF type:complete len:224 (+),score=68.35 GHRR01002763.1:113-784(+)
MSATEGTQNVPRPLQRCCLGLLYYSQALEGQGKLPVCLGLPHTPTEHIRLDESKPVSQVNDFRFLCMGHSLYERPAASEQQQQQGKQRQAGPTSSQQHTHKLPYCEGLEVILGASVEATSAALAKAAAGARETAAAGHTLDAGVAASQSAAPASHAGPQRPHEDDLSAVLTSMFGGEDSAVVKGVTRFNKIAARNWDRMKTTANQAYNMTLKQLVDKLSGDQH